MRAQRQSRGLGVRRSLRARLLPRRKVNPWLDRYRVRRDGVYRHRVPYEQCLRMNNDFRNSSKFLNNSCRKPFVSEPLPRNRVHEGIKTIERVASDVPLIQPERELVNVASEMLLADLVIDAVQSALEDCPHALDAVCSGVPANVLTRRVVDSLLPEEEQSIQVVVGSVLIGEESRADFDVTMNSVLDFFHADRLERHGFRPSTTLPHSEYRSLANRAASEILFVGLVLVDFQTADESLIDLDRAAQFLQVFAARFAETVENEPRGFLSDSNFLRQLHRRNALASRDEQIHRVEPLVERHMRPLEDSPCTHGEVQFASVAAIVAILSDGDSLNALALRAGDAIRPETAFAARSRAGFVRVQLEEFEGADCGAAHFFTPLSFSMVLYQSRTTWRGYLAKYRMASIASGSEYICGAIFRS